MGTVAAQPRKNFNARSALTLESAGMPAALLLIILSGFTLNNYGLEIGFQFLILLIMAEAWNLLAGYAGLVSLGTASFVGIGGYATVGMLNHGPSNVGLALLVAGASAALLALLVSKAVFRLRGLYFTVGTLALAEALRLFMVNFDPLGGATGIFLLPDAPSLKTLFWLAVGCFGLTTLLMHAGTQGRVCVLLRAVRDDEEAAAQVGVRPFRIKLLVFVVSSFLIGMAGGLQGLKLGVIEPYGMFSLQWTVSVLTVVIIGGQGSRLGPLVGAVLVVALGELLADYPAFHLMLMGIFLIVIVRFAPRGLSGLMANWIKGARK